MFSAMVTRMFRRPLSSTSWTSVIGSGCRPSQVFHGVQFDSMRILAEANSPLGILHVADSKVKCNTRVSMGEC